MQTFKQMKEDSGKQAQLNAQMAKLLRKRDKEHAHQQEELAGAQAKAVQLAAENQKLREQVRLFLLSTQPELMQAVCRWRALRAGQGWQCSGPTCTSTPR